MVSAISDELYLFFSMSADKNSSDREEQKEGKGTYHPADKAVLKPFGLVWFNVMLLQKEASYACCQSLHWNQLLMLVFYQFRNKITKKTARMQKIQHERKKRHAAYCLSEHFFHQLCKQRHLFFGGFHTLFSPICTVLLPKIYRKI